MQKQDITLSSLLANKQENSDRDVGVLIRSVNIEILCMLCNMGNMYERGMIAMMTIEDYHSSHPLLCYAYSIKHILFVVNLYFRHFSLTAGDRI